MTAHSQYCPNVTGTEAERKLSIALARTFPGQASFADETIAKECRQCACWRFNGYDGKRELKQGKCQKAMQMAGRDQPKFPGNASACKYFAAGVDHPYRAGMEGDYRQVNGPDHLWRDTRRELRAAEREGRADPKQNFKP